MTSEHDEAVARQLWAAMVLTRDLDTCRSILEGERVRVGNLDPFFLHRALRGRKPPTAESYMEVTMPMLYAVYEAGPDPRKS